jgi:hypothetical protein
MSSGMQHKMYNLEIAPPEGVWNNICEELDASLLSAGFPKKLIQAEVTPPGHVWKNIAGLLNADQFENTIAAKLQNAEAQPPLRTWEKIESVLYNYNNEKPLLKKLLPLVKYAAAAILTGALIWIGARYINQESKPDITAAKEVKVAPASANDALNPEKTSLSNDDVSIARTGVEAALEEARNDAALEASKKTYAKLDPVVIEKKIRNVTDFNFITANPEETDGNDDNYSKDISQRYIVLMTPDGNFIRMSKKLKDLVCCISGEEVDEACLEQLKRWREKILSSTAIHAPGSFGDILNIVTSLQENK